MLQIAAHLGGGVGKAIAGMIGQTIEQIEYKIILLETPRNNFYVDLLRNHEVPVVISDDVSYIAGEIQENDVTIVNWWGHPLVIRLLMELPVVKGRFVIWNHINGCSYPYLNAEFLNCFNRILFTSPYSEQNPFWNSEERKKVLEKSTVVYGMGDFDPAGVRYKKNFFADGIVLGYAGTLNYAKLNCKWFDYYRKVVESFENVRILMLGEPSKEVLDDAEKSGLKEHIRFTGYVSDVYKYYLKMDIFAYFLGHENYATTENSMIEAMASGLPVIALNNPVEAYIVENYENGVLINSPDEFVEVVKWLAKDRNAKRLGERAREDCIRKYSPEENTQAFCKVCRAALEDRVRSVCFKDVVGTDPFDAFCRQTGRDRVLFEKIRNFDNVTGTEIRALHPIYKEADKASVRQFLRYFPGNKDLKIVEEYINRYEN